MRVAETGVEPVSGGYEPPEIPFLYSAMYNCYSGIYENAGLLTCSTLY